MNIIRHIFKYFLVGICIGLGMISTSFVYDRYYAIPEYEARTSELTNRIDDLYKSLYRPGDKTFWEILEERSPEPLIVFNLVRYKELDSGFEVSGHISNQGPGIWSQYLIEIEVYDKDGEIIAECQEWLSELSPGQQEMVILNCPYTTIGQGRDGSEVTFRVKIPLLDRVSVREDS